MTLKLKTVAPRQGLRWVRHGFAVFLRKPLPFAALFGAFLFVAMVLLLLPFVGGALLFMWLPLVSLAFMLATHQVLQRRMPTPALLVQPLQHDPTRRRALLQLGIAYMLATFVILLISDAVDGGSFARLQSLMADPQRHREEIDALVADPRLQAGLLLRFGLAGLLSVPFWHAPALVYWDRQGAGQALFSSTLAIWRARGAFLVYGLGWVAATMLVGIAANLLFLILGSPQLLGMVALGAGLVFSTAFYASLYFTFADSFETAAGPPAPSVQVDVDLS